MTTAGPLAHFVGPDVLDPVFQELVKRGIPLGEARREIMEALQSGDLRLSVRVAGGARALQPMHFTTKEEEEQAREEYRTAVAKYDYDAAEDAIYGTSPSDGIIGLLSPETWGHTVTLIIRDRRLFIRWLFPTFPPESYSFAIANPEAADRLLATVGTAQEPGVAVSRYLEQLPPRPPDGSPEIEYVVWAIRCLRIADPDKLKLRGKRMHRLVCSMVGPNFSCHVRTVQRGRKLERADSSM